MPARTRSPRLPKVPTIQERIAAHDARVKHIRDYAGASEECKRWALRGIELANAGRLAEAKAARQKAERCMAKMMELEGK